MQAYATSVASRHQASRHAAARMTHSLHTQHLDEERAGSGPSPKPWALPDGGIFGASGAAAHFRKGQTVLCEGEAADRCFQVVRGVVRAYKLLPDGRRQIVDFLFPGEVLGLTPDDTYDYSADAVTEVTLQALGRAAIERLAAEQPALAARLRDCAYRELRAAQAHIVLLGRKSACEKVASFLLDLAQRAKSATRDGNVAWAPMSQSDIADYLGLTTETVNRIVAQLRGSGLISVPARGVIRVNQPRELQDMANAA